MYLIRRKSGHEVTSQQIIDTWNDVEKYIRNFYIKIPRLLGAFFKLNTLHDPARQFNSCAELAVAILQKLGYVHRDACVSNVLPSDIYKVKFYQSVQYERELMFDKQINTYSWFSLIPFIQLGWITPETRKSKRVQDAVGEYQPV
jgi:hypothetical protein